MNETEALRKFQSKVVKARSAYACCRKGYLRSAQYLLELMDFVRERFAAGPNVQPAVVTLPRVEPFVRVTAVPKPGNPSAVVFGIVEIATGSQTDSFDGPETEGELQAVARFVNAATETTRRATQDCIRCIDKALLSQRKRRRSVTLTKKLPGDWGDRKLNLRVPHA